MRQTKLINIHPVVGAVFQNTAQTVNKRLHEIHVEQSKECNSPNFYYKGETHILVKSLPLNPLHESLIPSMKSYLKYVNTVSHKRSKLIYLLNSFCQSNPLSDLFYILPKEAHQFLPTDRFVIQSQEYIDNINHEFDEEILTIIQEQLLHNLLL